MNKTKAKLISFSMILLAFIVGLYGYTRPEKLLSKQGVFYYIFVRNYIDSDKNGIGDIRGIIENLDLLNDANPNTSTDLGISGIVLSPIYLANAFDKSQPLDYYKIDPEYGTIQDLEELINQANKRGIKIIMEMDFNHTSIEHEWFKQAVSSANSPFRSYYKLKSAYLEPTHFPELVNEDNMWHKYEDLKYFSNSLSSLADLNYDNEELRNNIKEIAAFYLEKGISGLKLKHINEIYSYYEEPDSDNRIEKNLDWWQSFKMSCKEVYKDVYLIGEVEDKNADIAPYYKEFNTIMNIYLAEKGIPTVVNIENDLGFQDGMFASKIYNMNVSYKKYSKEPIDGIYLSSPMHRIMSKVTGDLNKAKLSANIMFTLPGNTFIYYKDEIGYNDAREQSADSTIFNHYVNLIRLRQLHPALNVGNFIKTSDDNKKILSYIRYDAKSKENILVVHNLSGENQKVFIKELKSYDIKRIVYTSSNQDIIDKESNMVNIAKYSTVIINLE